MNFPLIANIVVFVVLLFALAQTRHKQWSLAKKVLVGLVMGVVFGLALHTIYGSDSQVLKDSVQWFNIVGNGYVQLLQMIVMPLECSHFATAYQYKSIRIFGGRRGVKYRDMIGLYFSGFHVDGLFGSS